MSLEITYLQGGMREFERTGIYPEYLRFHKPGTRQNWLIRIKKTPQQGVLKSKGKVVYEYSFNKGFCRYREVRADCSFTEWMEPEFMMSVMRD